MKLYLSGLLAEKEEYNGFWKEFKSTLNAHSINPVLLPKTRDIWCRDYMPVQVGEDEFVQFTLAGDYYPKENQHLRTDPAPICQELGIIPTVPDYKGTPVYLDGGNVVRGFRKAIICGKVFEDNDIPVTKLLDILTEVLRVEKIIIVPWEYDDYTGHADGMVRFLDERTVLANDYSGENAGKGFREKFNRALRSASLDIIRVPYHPVDSTDYCQPATGVYINYLQAGSKIFLPTFGDERNDQEAIRRFGELFGAGNIIPVSCEEIARSGGCLNCLSWEIL